MTLNCEKLFSIPSGTACTACTVSPLAAQLSRVSRCSEGAFSQATTPTDVSDSSDSDEPLSNKKAVSSGYNLRYGFDVAQGLRSSMEDRSVAVDLSSECPAFSSAAFFGVFDGHAGHQVAQFASDQFLPFLLADDAFASDPSAALERAFRKTDDAWQVAPAPTPCTAGSTALAALVLDTDLYIGNLGDCRAVLCRDMSSKQLTHDHKADAADERQRLEGAGWDVSADGYVFGELAVSRALGLRQYKGDPARAGAILSDPDVGHFQLEPQDDFLVLASDGLWDVLQNQEVVRITRRELEQHNDPGKCAGRLVKEALMRDSTDNVSVIVVCFKAGYALRRTNSRLNIRGCSGSQG